MSGSCSAFHDIDTQIHDVVKFGDNSEVLIEGAETMVLKGRGDVHIPIMGVYFILRLATNIISLDQLDEDDCDVHIKKGVLRIRDPQQRLLVRAKRSTNRLYTLRVCLARLLCLVTQQADKLWLLHEHYDHLHFDTLRKMVQ